MGARPAIALCSEYPLSFRGGVSVIVEQTILGLGDEFDFWLVNPESEEEARSQPAGGLLAGHIRYQTPALPPSSGYYGPARKLVEQMQKVGLQAAHFHCGGIYGWGNRWPGASIPAMARASGIRSCWTNHSVVGVSRGFILGALWKQAAMLPMAWLGKRAQMKAVDRELAVSRHDRDLLGSRFPFLGKPIDVLYHSRIEEEPVTGPGGRRPVILSVGHVARRKGHHVLVKAFLLVCEQIPSWTLELIGPNGGDGCWQEIESMISFHPQGSRVRLLGECHDVLPRLAGAGFYVQPSLEEALGLAVQEALFAGCPVIASRVGGLPEVVEEGINGILVPAGQVEALGDAICSFARDAELRARMGAAARSSIERKGMTRKRMIESLRSLYRTMLARPGAVSGS